MSTYAVDFETYYDDECSVATLGPRAYFSHPAFVAYLVTIVGDDGFEWAGDPADFDWSKLDTHQLVSHNASFDEALHLFGSEMGWWNRCFTADWDCTADMAAYLGFPRSLAGACEAAFKEEVDKGTRRRMKGRRPEAMTPEFLKEVTEYALEDSRKCLKLWLEFEDKWPMREREISRHTRRMVYRGLPIDLQRVEDGIRATAQLLFEYEQSIPWGDRAALLSRKELNKHCAMLKLDPMPPASLDAKDPKAKEFFDAHGEKHPWLIAYRDLRRVNALNLKLRSLANGVCGDPPRYYGGLMYAGAHTRRWSGGGGSLNLQNLPKKEMFGADIRRMIRPPEGRKLVVADLAQIEIRTCLWLSGDFEALKVIDEIGDVYEALAVMFDLHVPDGRPLAETNPALRNNCKIVGLGIQFGAAEGKVAQIAGISPQEAAVWITRFRKRFPKTVALWKRLRQLIAYAAHSKEDLEIGLPSGNAMIYRNVRRTRDGIYCDMVRNGRKAHARLWHGSVIENLSQSLARDVFADGLLKIEQAWPGRTILHVHDEVVLEVSDVEAEECLRDVIRLLSEPPDWIPNIALDAAGEIVSEYCKM